MNNGTVKILIVEDNPGDVRLIREMLAESQETSFAIDWVPQLSSGLERLALGGIDLVLLDLGLPDSHGLETFVRAYAQAPQVPFVVLSGLNDETVALTAVREGAQDYLVKGQTDSGLLLRAIRYATERKKIEEDLRREIEERRAAEMAVETERRRLFVLLDGLPAMVSLIAPDFSLVFGNRIYGELFRNWQGKRCYEAVFGKGEPCEGCPALQVMENRALNVKELTVPVNDRVFNIYFYPFTDVDGTALVLSLGIDITERKRAEEALEAERQRLYSLLDGLPGLVYLKAPDYSLKFANRLFREICGDWEGKKCYEAMFKSEQPCENCTQFQVLETGEPSVKEATYGDSNRTYQIYSYPFADVDGASLVLTLGIDISERKRAEEALRRQKAEQQIILDSVPAMIFYKDINNYFVRVNKTLTEITGLAASEIEGKSAFEIFPNQAEDYFRDDQRVISSGYPKRNIIEPTQTIEGLRWVQTDKIPYRDDNDKIIGIIGFAIDITERKRAEEQLQESEERLRYLASQLMTAQEDERKRISRELHDELGQALLVLRLQTRAIERDLQPEQQQLRGECLEMLGNLDQVVDNVRRLSRDLSPILLEDLGLSAALHHLIKEFGKHYQIKYSAQETNIDDLFPQVAQVAIYRIVQESLTNIGKHSQANLLLVAITKHDDRVSILIRDNGKGFDPEQLRRQKPGMGLAAMEERARMAGGVLSIWSQEGAGTKISLEIPYSVKPK